MKKEEFYKIDMDDVERPYCFIREPESRIFVQEQLLDTKKHADSIERYLDKLENGGVKNYKEYTLLAMEYHTLRTLQFILEQRLVYWGNNG